MVSSTLYYAKLVYGNIHLFKNLRLVATMLMPTKFVNIFCPKKITPIDKEEAWALVPEQLHCSS